MGSTLCARFTHEADNLVEFCSKFDQFPTEDLTESLLETKLQCLEEDWQRLIKAYEDIMISDEKTVASDLKGKAKIKFESVRDRLQITKANMLDLLKCNRPTNINGSRSDGPTGSFTSDPTHSTLYNYSEINHVNTTFDASEICIKVPPCDTQEFYRGYEEWPAFRDMFTAIYANHSRLTQAQKLYHLRNKTKGEAGSMVKKYNLSDQNFALAWDALKTRYENKRVLIENQLDIIYDIPVATTETYDALYRIQSTISDCLSILKTHCVSIGQCDFIFVHVAKKKLPMETLALWEQSLPSRCELSTWNQMETFLINRQQVVESLSKTRQYNQIRNKQTYQVNSGQSSYLKQSGNQVRVCKLCNKGHYLRNCSVFQNFTVSQRIDYVDRNNFCSNGLSSLHKNKDCPSLHTCAQCKSRHHSLLHLNRGNRTQGRGDNVQTFHVDTNQNLNGSIDLESPGTSHSVPQQTTQTHVTVGQGDVLLPTALVQIRHSGEIFYIRALIDCASKNSYVTTKIAKRIGFKTDEANYGITGFGGVFVGNSDKVCTITLCAPKHKFELSSQFIIVPKLANSMPSISVSKPNLTDVQDLELADPKFYVSAQVDMLIGSDILPFINLNGLRGRILGNLMAQNSVYGWYIYGPLKMHSVSLVTLDAKQREDEDENLSVMLRKFWEVEEIPQQKVISDAD